MTQAARTGSSQTFRGGMGSAAGGAVVSMKGVKFDAITRASGCFGLPFAPLQFLTQDIEERLVGSLKKKDLRLRSRAFDRVSGLQRAAHLAIHGEEESSSFMWLRTRIGRSDGIRRGRLVSVCGQIGVRQTALTVGNTMGPPAASEYAVEPVGVETIRPSALYSQTNVSPAHTSRSTMRAIDDLAMTTSLKRFIFSDNAVSPTNRNVQQVSARQAMYAGEGTFEFGEELTRPGSTWKAESRRDSRLAMEWRGPPQHARREQRAIAAQNDCEIAAFRDAGAGKPGYACRICGGYFIQAHRDIPIAEPGQQFRHETRRRRGLRFGEDAYSLNGGHRAETPCCLPRLYSGFP